MSSIQNSIFKVRNSKDFIKYMIAELENEIAEDRRILNDLMKQYADVKEETTKLRLALWNNELLSKETNASLQKENSEMAEDIEASEKQAKLFEVRNKQLSGQI